MIGFRRNSRSRRPWIVILAIILLIGGGYWTAHSWYENNLAAVNSSVSQTVYFSVDSGSSLQQIGLKLKQAGLIKSAHAFEIYARGRRLAAKIQTGTYSLSPSMSTPQILDKMVRGDVSKDLLTILPGKTLKQIKPAFKKAGYSDADINAAFDPATYAGHPLLANLPAGGSLEGLLYPDSFQKQLNTPASTIVRESLDEMQNLLTPDIVNGFSAQGLSVYQGLTLSSIVYQESGDSDYQPTVAQVFLLRLKQGMSLGSDVTAFYAANQIGAGKTLGVDSPYNTRLHSGLPPGPIGNFSVSAMNAVAHPSSTDYLFFVAGDDGVIHFSHTGAEHEQATKQYCTKECS
ncbi:endolytic transglycosylase MltG [Candidatus Saccharibacteria bacterium]|nr:endolytic transglycosylase MltG [Candidatus Saccharibacteria bacterium]